MACARTRGVSGFLPRFMHDMLRYLRVTTRLNKAFLGKGLSLHFLLACFELFHLLHAALACQYTRVIQDIEHRNDCVGAVLLWELYMGSPFQ